MSSTKKQLIFGALFVSLAGLLVVGLNFDLFETPSQEPKKEPKQEAATSSEGENLKGAPDKVAFEGASWELYKSDEFGFSFFYPTDWQLTVSTDEDASPKISLTKNEASSSSPASNQAQLLVYPQGSEASLPQGKAKEAELSLAPRLDEKIAYPLKNGEIWALKASFQEPPQSWSEEGFLFARLQLNNLESFCKKEGGQLTSGACREGEGELVREAEVNKESWQKLLRVLATFQFESTTDISQGIDFIKLSAPEEESTVESPLQVEGEVRGTWFIEGGFPVYLKADTGEVIASTTANPSTNKKGFATSTDLVSFQAELEFKKEDYEEAKLVLEEPGVSGFSTEPARKEITLYFEN